MSSQKVCLIISLSSLIALSACNSENSSEIPSVDSKPVSNVGALPTAGQPPGTSPLPNPSPTPTPTPSPEPSKGPSRSYQTAALIFNGDGAWTTEVSSLESILSSNSATYQTVTSAQLNAMTLDQLSTFGTLIFPGGSGGTEAGSLTAATHALLRSAVQERGVSYIGFCAGAFIAVAPAPAPGADVSYGLGIVNGPILDYYYLENTTDIAMTLETFPDGSTRDLVWYGGPVTPNISGGIIAKYPTGDPAITQIWSGTGFVILSGVHPAAPQSVRTEFGLVDADGLDFALAWKLLQAAIQQAPLPAF